MPKQFEITAEPASDFAKTYEGAMDNHWMLNANVSPQVERSIKRKLRDHCSTLDSTYGHNESSTGLGHLSKRIKQFMLRDHRIESAYRQLKLKGKELSPPVVEQNSFARDLESENPAPYSQGAFGATPQMTQFAKLGLLRFGVDDEGVSQPEEAKAERGDPGPRDTNTDTKDPETEDSDPGNRDPGPSTYWKGPKYQKSPYKVCPDISLTDLFDALPSLDNASTPSSPRSQMWQSSDRRGRHRNSKDQTLSQEQQLAGPTPRRTEIKSRRFEKIKQRIFHRELQPQPPPAQVSFHVPPQVPVALATGDSGQQRWQNMNGLSRYQRTPPTDWPLRTPLQPYVHLSTENTSQANGKRNGSPYPHPFPHAPRRQSYIFPVNSVPAPPGPSGQDTTPLYSSTPYYNDAHVAPNNPPAAHLSGPPVYDYSFYPQVHPPPSPSLLSNVDGHHLHDARPQTPDQVPRRQASLRFSAIEEDSSDESETESDRESDFEQVISVASSMRSVRITQSDYQDSVTAYSVEEGEIIEDTDEDEAVERSPPSLNAYDADHEDDLDDLTDGFSTHSIFGQADERPKIRRYSPEAMRNRIFERGSRAPHDATRPRTLRDELKDICCEDWVDDGDEEDRGRTRTREA